MRVDRILNFLYFTSEFELTLQRYLDEHETQIIEMVGPGNGFALLTCKYEGTIDSSALTRALDHLCTQYPILCSKIMKEDGKYLFFVPDDYRPTLQITHGESLILSETRSLGHDRNGECVRALLIKGATKGYVTLGIDHMIVDAASASHYWTELWQMYTDIVNGKEVESTPGDSLPPPRSELQSSLVLRKDASSSPTGEPLTDASKQSPGMDAGEIQLNFPPAHVKQVTLSKNETKELREFCRSHGLGVSAFIAGSMLSLLRKLERQKEDGSMNIVTVVDMRRNTLNPIEAKGTGLLTWRAFRKFDIPSDEEPLETVRRVHQLFSNLRNEIPDAPPSRTELRKQIGAIDLRFNNGGELMANVTTPENLNLVDFLSPSEYGDEEGNTITPNSFSRTFSAHRSSINCFTFNGMLKLILTLRGDLDDEILRKFTEKLKACA